MKSGSRFRITSLLTGRRWDVEVIQPRQHHRTEFGDSLDSKCDGAISESESQITEKTHKNIRVVKNPFDHIGPDD